MMRLPIVALLLVVACGEKEDPPGRDLQPQQQEAEADAGEKGAEEEPAAGTDFFFDEAKERGIDLLNQTGRPGVKEFIMSAVGPGAAVFDANGDGLMDLYLPNGTWLVGPKRNRFYEGPDRPRNALYIQRSDGTFRDEAKARGVDDDAWSFGACAADLDGDGDQDLIVTNLGPNRLYENDGDGRFRDVAKEAGIAGNQERSTWEWSTGIAIADYDEDGILDVYIANYADMFRWMEEAKEIWGSDGAIRDARICTWQRLKVYCGPKGLPGQQDHLYRGKGGLRFEDVTAAAGVELPQGDRVPPYYGFQPLFTDLTGDGLLDIYVANDSVPSVFFENRGDGTFVERASHYQIAKSGSGTDMAGMGVDSADLDRNGYPDVVKTNFAKETYNLYMAIPRAEGGVIFQDRSARMGIERRVFNSLGWGVLPFDYDNDGDLDLFFANGHVYPEVDSAPELQMSFEQLNQLFRNDGRPRPDGTLKLRFNEVTETAGPGLRVRKGSRGASLADFDNDGDLDVVVVNLNDVPTLLVNRLGNRSGHWLRIRLEGDPSRNCPPEAIGSRVQVRAGDLVQLFETKRGQSFLGCHDPRLHVGLGDHAGPVEVSVVWPNGDRTTHALEGVDREVVLRQKR